MKLTSTFRKTVAFIMAILMVMGMFPVHQSMEAHAATRNTRVIFLDKGVWGESSADINAWVWGGSTADAWYDGVDTNEDGVLAFVIPADATDVIFLRKNPSNAGLNWDGEWNRSQTTLSSSKNCYKIYGWNNYGWTSLDVTYIVAGEAELTTSSWNGTDTSNKMTKNSDGTYSITYSGVPAGDHEFKITANGEWMWSGANEKVSLSKVSDVTITLNPANSTVTIANSEAETTTTYNVTYSGTNVTCISGSSTATAGVDYTATLIAATGYTLPDTIAVTVGGIALNSGYSYDKSTGVVTISAAKITGDINIKAEGVKEQVEEPDTITLYLDPGVWEGVHSPYAIHYWYSGQSGVDVSMTEKDGTYYAEIPADADYVIFQAQNWTKQTSDLAVPTDGKNMYTITGWDNGSNNICPGKWSTYGSSSSEEEDGYFVNADIVDYLNDYRVNFANVNGYSNDNQGIWMNGQDNPVYTYLNYIISQNAKSNDGTVNYTYPLYFGNMLFISNRYGTPYQSFENYDGYNSYRKNNKKNLNNWNTGANVALPNTWDAVVQGLVGNQLDKYGQLVDPVTGKQLFYFDKTSIESWTTSSGTDGKRLMAYYSNLQFPFKTSYDPNTRVTTYSYNSAKDDAVFIDFEKYNADSDSNPMYTDSNYAKDEKGNKGFFPLNKPGDSENGSNYAFGVKFTIDFTVSDDGTIVSADGKETPVKFSFTGDDDVWVFIDGHLVLDMGGAHSLATGTIDFQTLTATVGKAAQVSDVYYNPSYYNNSYGYEGDGEQRESLTVETNKSTAFPEVLAKAFQNEYNTGISQVHTLTMFYMERAGIESNMSIEFSMSPIPTGLTISKDIENVNPGLNDDVQADDEFSFTIDATDADGKKVPFDGYELTDHGSVTTDGVINGNIISGIRGDKYAHNFTSAGLSAFTAGTKFTITEGSYDTSKYSGTRWVLYNYSDGYTEVDRGDGMAAAFTMLQNSTGNYALNFVNSLNTGTLTITKDYIDTLINTSNMSFKFNVYLDVTGKSNPDTLHPGLTYDIYEGNTLVSENIISEDGTIVLKAGQTAKINGIPVGTSYRVVEIDDSVLWETVGSNEISGKMTINGATYTVKNQTTATKLDDKYIYVEAGKDTAYDIVDGTKDIILNSVSSNSANLSVSISGGKVIVNGVEANQVYSFQYAGTYADGSYVSGAVKVYTFSATIKNYIFDFGLSADLEDPTNGNGLFQGAIFDNEYASGESSKLVSLSGKGNTQTTITATLNGSFDANNRYIVNNKFSKVIFTPVAFMSEVETYTYEVRITASGKTFNANNPETGCVVTGTIRVMPANTVYYEEGFNSSASEEWQKIVYSKDVTLGTPDKTLTQSNGITGPYGYDSIYDSYYKDSNGSVATLGHLDYAYFTFTGTGFDLISQTNATSAGLAVYVFKGEHTTNNLNYVTNLNNTTLTPDETVFVHTFYNNGDLHQVPVINVRLDAQDTYTVYIQAMKTHNGSTVAIDGIRIYNPLEDTQYYNTAEKNAVFSELRQLMNSNRGDGVDEVNDSRDALHLANLSNGNLYVGLGKQSVVMQSLIENPELNGVIGTSSDLKEIYQQGPNNEMYLAKNFGVMFTYSVTDTDWTLQLGAKSVTKGNSAKSVSIYVRVKDADAFENVATITLSTATDMYYDLTQYLSEYCSQGSTYELFIISNSAASNNEFVSLTSVKHAGVKLGEG